MYVNKQVNYKSAERSEYILIPMIISLICGTSDLSGGSIRLNVW